jgi:hypothetical protein
MATFECVGYPYKDENPQELMKYYEEDFMSKIVNNHGPLLAARPTGTDYKSEGDNPSWLHQIPTGLRQLDNPTYGGWGGRFRHMEDTKNVYYDCILGYDTYCSDFGDDDNSNLFKCQNRWASALQNDFLARADWCVKSFADANHPPAVKLAHPMDLTASPGDVVQLSAEGTTDPDNNTLSYDWWVYKDPSKYKGSVSISNSTSQKASLTIPGDFGSDDNIHVICQVTDNGTPPLERYKRIIISYGNLTSTGSPVKNLTVKNNDVSVQPTKGVVKIVSPVRDVVSFSISRLDGRIIAVKKVDVRAGEGLYSWEALHGMAPGSYILHLESSLTDRAITFNVQ